MSFLLFDKFLEYGKLRPKVFKLAKKKLKASEILRLSKKHSFRAINTRKYYAGQHLLEIQINAFVPVY